MGVRCYRRSPCRILFIVMVFGFFFSNEGLAQIPSNKIFAITSENHTNSNVYGPVKSTDSLGFLAQDLRPHSHITMHQMVIALLRTNPDAFRRNNINYLKTGSFLRVPPLSVIEAIDATEARREYLRQNAEWKGGDLETVDTYTESVIPEKQINVQYSTNPRRLEETLESDLPIRQQGSGERIQRLKQELTVREQEISSLKREVEALKVTLSEQQSVTYFRKENAVTKHTSVSAVEEDQVLSGNDSVWVWLGAFVVMATVGLIIWVRRRKRSVSLQGNYLQDLNQDSNLQTGSANPSHINISDVQVVLHEADILLAYRRLEQARQLLIASLDIHIENIDLKLKLSQVYFYQNDKEDFSLIFNELSPQLVGEYGEIKRELENMADDLFPERSTSVSNS